MTVNGNASHMLSNANASMDIVRHSIEYMSTQNHINLTAYQLALTAEYLLKGLSYANGITPPNTHNHKLLASVLGKKNISLPMDFRRKLPVLYDYQCTTRYDSTVEVDKDELLDATDAVERYLKLVWEMYTKESVQSL